MWFKFVGYLALTASLILSTVLNGQQKLHVFFPSLWREVACISVCYSYTQDYLTSNEELYFRALLEYKDYHLGIRTRLIVSCASWY